MTHYTPFPRPDPQPAHVCATLSLADGTDDLLVRHVRLLRDCVALAQARWEFTIDAAVVMPNEMHLLCAFPDPEFGVSSAMRLIKSAFCRHVPGQTGASDEMWEEMGEVLKIAPSVVPLRRAYLEAAPVRAGLVKRPQDWPFSSAHEGEVLASHMGVALA